MSAIRRLFWRRKEERGQALVEFTFVLMAFLLFIFGIIEGSRLFESWVTVQHASREAARFGVTGEDTCDAAVGDREACIEAMAAEQLELLSNSGAAVIDISHYAFPDYLDPPTANDAGGPCDLIEVHVEYDHEIVVPLIGAITGNTVHLETEERMVNEPFGSC